MISLITIEVIVIFLAIIAFFDGKLPHRLQRAVQVAAIITFFILLISLIELNFPSSLRYILAGGSVIFIVIALIWPVWKQPKAVNDLLVSLHFFVNNWDLYKKSIQKRDLKSSQNSEVKRDSDQVKDAITRIRLMNLKGKDEVLNLVEKKANDMAKLGIDILRRFPNNAPLKWALGDDLPTPSDLISRGDVLCEDLKCLIPIVEKTFRRFFLWIL